MVVKNAGNCLGECRKGANGEKSIELSGLSRTDPRDSSLPLCCRRRNLAAMSELPVSASKEVLGGTPVFTGTRVPVQSLIEFLGAGDSIDDFLAAFPSVKRAQVVTFLEKAANLAVTAAA